MIQVCLLCTNPSLTFDLFSLRSFSSARLLVLGDTYNIPLDPRGKKSSSDEDDFCSQTEFGFMFQEFKNQKCRSLTLTSHFFLHVCIIITCPLIRVQLLGEQPHLRLQQKAPQYLHM